MRRTLSTPFGPIGVRRGVLLEVRGEDGGSGWGDCAPIPGFDPESLDSCVRTLREHTAGWIGREIASTNEVDELLRGIRSPSCAAAIDVAIHDWVARTRGCGIAELLCGNRAVTRVPVSALIVGTSAQEVEATARAARREGYGSAKLKIGALPLETDLERVRALRSGLGEGVAIRLDANAAWDAEQALAALKQLEFAQPEFVEQPVPAQDIVALASVRRRSSVPIAADEALWGEASLTPILELAAADWVVLKLPRLGGLRSARRVAQRARAQGLGVVVTSHLDSAIGVASALELAASLGSHTAAAGIATGSLLLEDVASGFRSDRGHALRSGVGLGVAPDRSRLRTGRRDAL